MGRNQTGAGPIAVMLTAAVAILAAQPASAQGTLSPQGDITSVGATSNGGLTGGATRGAALLGLLTTCTDGQILKWTTATTSWGCAADTGGTVIAGAGLTLTGTTIDAIGSSDFAVTADLIDLSTAVTAPGSMSVATTLDVDGDLAKFGSSDGHTYVAINTLNFQHAALATAAGWINYTGYLGGITQFRDLNIADGKNVAIATFTGSTKAVTLAGTLGVTGLVTATAGVTTPANLTTTGTGALTVAGTTTVGQFSAGLISPAAVTGLVNDWAPTGIATATTIRISNTGAVDLTGLSGGADGRRVTLCNAGASQVILYHENINSIAANRFQLTNANGWTLAGGANSCMGFVYSGAVARYIQVNYGGKFFPGLDVGGDLTQTAGSISTSGNITTTGAGNLTVAGSATVTGVLDVNNNLSKFGGTADGDVFTALNTLGFQYATNAVGTGYINYYGYNGGITQFRNLAIADGKGADIASFIGSTKATSLAGALTVTGSVVADDKVTSGGADPVISACGAAPDPTVVGGRLAFKVVVGGGAPTSCTITFPASTYGSTPACVHVTNSSTVEAYISAESATAITLTGKGTSTLGGLTINTICMGV